MKIILTILFVLAGIIALLLIIALFIRKTYHINREITINAPRQKIFEYLKHLKNQVHFNKWVMVDPDMKMEFKGIDGTVGFIFLWNGNKKAGEGEQEILTIDEGKKIETEIRFVRPFASIAYANLETESVTDNQTKVSWINAGAMIYPMNIMVSGIDKMLAKDMDTSLSTLKNILEK